jgi:hypothetical protein
MESMHPSPQPLPWYRRWWFYLLLVLVAVVLGLIVRSEYVKWAARRDLEETLAELERTEPHWNLRTWYRSYEVPAEEQNLALVGLKMQQGFARESSRFLILYEQRDQYPGNPLNAEQVSELRKVLTVGGEFGGKDLKAGLNRLFNLKVGHFPALDIQSSKFKILTIGLNPQQQLRQTATLLGYQAELWAHEGRGDDALEACRGILHLAHAVDNDPFLISQLIGVSIQGHAVTVLERVLAQTTPSEEALIKLQEACLREAGHSFAEKAALADRAGMDQLFLEVEKGRYGRFELQQMGIGRRPPATVQDYLGIAQEWVTGSRFDYIPRERVRSLRFFKEVISLLRQPEGGLYQQLRDLHDRYPQQSPAPLPFGAVLIKTFESDCKRKARLRAAAAVLAAERFRRATGKSPQGWSDLVPKDLPSIPTDPFDGTPLRWKKTATGFRIESLWLGGGIQIDPKTEMKGNGVEFWHGELRRKLPSVPLPEDLTGQPQIP